MQLKSCGIREEKKRKIGHTQVKNHLQVHPMACGRQHGEIWGCTYRWQQPYFLTSPAPLHFNRPLHLVWSRHFLLGFHGSRGHEMPPGTGKPALGARVTSVDSNSRGGFAPRGRITECFASQIKRFWSLGVAWVPDVPRSTGLVSCLRFSAPYFLPPIFVLCFPSVWSSMSSTHPY